MALYLDALGQIVVASSMPSGGSAVPAQPSSNLVDTAPWFRSRDDGSIQWHPANYYSGSGETSLLLTGMLTIPVSVVNSSTTGVVPVGGFANATGTFRVWLGTQDVTTLCTFTAGTPNNITASINSSTGVYSATAMPDAQSYGSIVFTASYKGQSLVLTYVVTKAKDGVVGANGANFSIDQASAIFNKSSSGVVTPSTGIPLTTSYQNVSAITGYVWKKGISVISGATSSSYTIPIADYNSTTTNTYSCTITGTINNVVGATLTDTITVPMLLDGSSTPTVVLSNENMTFPASNIGFSGINFASGSCEVTAYIGATQLTYSATGGANTFKCTVSATNVTVAGGTISGTKLILPAPTAMSADSAYLDISTTIYDSTGTALSGLLVSRVTYALSRAGIKGDTGDAVDFIFVRSALQPATPAASAGVPSSPVQWYTDVASVPAGINPLWSSVGFKATGGTNYTWDTPSRIEGANVAEVSVYTRGVPTTTPSGGTYTFGSATPITSVPTSTGATWSADIPTGTSPVYISRVVVSAPAGNTSAVNITGWSTPVISFQNGVDTTSYWISCTDSLKRSTSLVYTPTTVSMTAYSKTGTANPSVYAGRFKVYENGSLTPSYTSATDQSTYAYTPSANNLTQLKVEVYLAGGTTTKLDEQTIPILQDGSSAISIVDSNNNVTIPTASDGSSSGTYPNSGTTIQVFEGSTALTYTTGVATSGKFSVAVSQNPTSSITLGTTSGNNTTSFIIGNHSNMVTGTNSVSIVFTITAVKSDGTSITLTENQTITKAKAGVPSYTWTKYATDAFGTGLTDSPTGMSYIGIASNQSSATESTNASFYTWSKILGDTGLAGTSVYMATIYYQPNPASTPSAPSGGTYVFNGNTLTAPSPWSKTMPAASQTLPTYQCQFTFVTNPPTTTINSTLTAGTWSSPTVVSQLGINGSSGSTAVRVYLKNSSSSAASSNPSGNITATGSSNDTWYTNTQTLATGQFQWQCDGTYNPNTTSTTWGSPYLTVFKVDTLSAFTVKTGNLLSRPINNGSAVMTINSTPDGVYETNEFRSYNGVSVVTSMGDGLISGQSSMSALDGGTAGTYSLAKEVLCYLNTNNSANASTRFLIGLNLTTKSYGWNGNLAQYAGGQAFRSRGYDDDFNIDLGYAKRISLSLGNAEVLMGGRFYTKMDDSAANNLVAILSGDFSKLATDTDVYRHLPVTSAGNTIFNTTNENSLAGQKAAGIFSDNATTVFLCDTNYAINVKRGNIKSTGSISVGGNVTAYDGSDKRIKENIKPIENSLDKVLKISGNTFKWIHEYYDKQDKELFKEFDVGVIAQEIQEVLPQATHLRSDGILAVNYVKIIPLLIEAIKEQQKQIEELRNGIA
jgi:hypothetical protein